jgi:Zn-dependent metalloprotease
MITMRLVLIVCLGFISSICFSNVQLSKFVSAEKIEYSIYSSIPSQVKFKKEDGLPFSQVQSYLASFFEGEQQFSLKLVDTQKDQLGFIHYRYQEVLDGVPVSFAYYVVHSKNDFVVSMNGLLFDNIKKNSSKISMSEALILAINHVGAKEYMWENPQEQDLLRRQTNNQFASYYPTGELVYVANPLDLKSEIKLSYKFTIYASNPLSKQDVFVDVENKSIIYSENLLHYKDVKGIANTVYSGVQTITTDSTNLGYTLKESGRGNGIETFNMKNSTNFSSYVDFVDKNNVWDTTNIQKDQYAVDAHWGAEMTYDYYFLKHNRNSIDDKGYKLINMVHYGSAFGNAYWDGTRMVFGDGDGTNTKNPLVSLDIIGHEITHGLTSNTAKLVSQNEAGALNESFSDIFGATIDWYARPNKANWKVGDEISSIYRSLEGPNSTNHPDTYQGDFWGNMNDADFGGIHSNNGVQNYWYYLLVQGGNGVNDKGNGYNVAAIGIDKAAAIAYRNLTVYLTSLSNYQDARFYSIQAAVDLYGSCSPEVESVTNAWYAVGVGSPYNAKVTSKFVASYGKSCRALKVNFTNSSDNAISYRWDFGDNTYSTEANPSHTYSVPGKYSVKLISKSSGLCGVVDSLEKVDWVNVYPYNAEPILVEFCSKDTMLKIVTSINNPVWFANDTSQVVLESSKTLLFQNPKKDTSFFVGSLDMVSDSTWKVGETNVTTNIGSYAATVRYQIFDVFKPITIKSVLVNAYTAGDRIVELRDAAGKVLQTKTVTIPMGVSRVDLNFEVDPGVDYQLGLGGTIGNLGRSNAGMKYPYLVKNVISIKGSNAVNAGLQFYYSFYDWEIISKGCKDGRQEYRVKLKECNTTGIQKETFSGLTVFPNPTTGNITVSNIRGRNVKIVDLVGNVLFENNEKSEQLDLNLTNWATGIYLIELTNGVSIEVLRIIKE